jgi:hypothetical protein
VTGAPPRFRESTASTHQRFRCRTAVSPSRSNFPAARQSYLPAVVSQLSSTSARRQYAGNYPHEADICASNGNHLRYLRTISAPNLHRGRKCRAHGRAAIGRRTEGLTAFGFCLVSQQDSYQGTSTTRTGQSTRGSHGVLDPATSTAVIQSHCSCADNPAGRSASPSS